MTLGTRAISVVIAPGGEWACPCPGCGERVKYTARRRGRKVICNLYATEVDHAAFERRRLNGEPKASAPVLAQDTGGVWDRVEEWHAECYEAAGAPYGPAMERKAPQTAGRRPKAADAVA